MAKIRYKPKEKEEKPEFTEVTVEETPQQELKGWRQWVYDPQKRAAAIFAAIALLIAGYLYYRNLQEERAKEALEQAVYAIRFFEKDSIDLALNGSGQYMGFLTLIEEYDGTPTAELCKYYAGCCYLKKQNYELALEYFEDVKKGENLVTVMTYAGMASAYEGLGKLKKAAKYYQKAAETVRNHFTSPMFLMDAAACYEMAGDKEKALEIYKTIKRYYPDSQEGQQVDKFIERLKSS